MIPARSRDGCRKDSFLNVAAVTLPVECRLPARYRNSVKVECRFEGPKVALRRHSTGTTRSPHDLAMDAEKIHFCERGAGDLALALALVLVLSALQALATGGRWGPERSFVNCMDAADLRIAAPGRPGPPRLRNALAVQARNPKRPRRAPPPSLDKPALGRPRRSGALYTACNGFNFALQTPIYTRCAPAATPRLSHATPAGPPALVAQTSRFAAKTPHAAQAVNLRALRPASGSRASG